MDFGEDKAGAEISSARLQFRGGAALGATLAPTAPPVILSRMKNDQLRPEQFLTPPVEDAFVFQIPLISSFSPEIRYGNRQILPQGICKPGWSYMLDMRQTPTRRLDTTFDNAILYIHQNTLDELAYEKRWTKGVRIAQPTFGERDPLMFHLAQAWLPILENQASASRLFVDHLALALHEHVLSAYGRQPAPDRRRGAALAPWQIRRIKDFIEANLTGNPSISDLARECDLSPSYFAEAFKETLGVSPHKWLLGRRVERAKAMLRDTEASLAAIALDCGFFDQSHFSRVFARFENCSPAAWRRYYRPH